VETIKARMLDGKKAPATIRYALAVVRQVFNFAIDHGMYVGSNPVSKVKKPSGDNKRVRFLTHDEAEALLDTIREKSADVYNISLLSLHTGMRAGEIFSLTWADVDLKGRMLTLRDTKNGRTRFARMTDQVVEMLFSLPKGKPDELVFPARGNARMVKISRTFERAVDELKLNEGVTDPRQMVVFHTLRHTYASWMLRSGADLYTVSKLLGHRTIAMTERYGHVADQTLQDAVRGFQKGLTEKAEEKGRNAE
jgi:integrase